MTDQEYQRLPSMTNHPRLIDMTIDTHEVTMKLTPAQIGTIAELLEEELDRGVNLKTAHGKRLEDLADLFGNVERDIDDLDRYQGDWKRNADKRRRFLVQA